MADATHTCEDCGHAYTERYGRWRNTPGGQRWLCHECADVRYLLVQPDVAAANELIDRAARFAFSITDAASGTTYRPWTNGDVVGFSCQLADGRVEYLYLNPSQTDGDEGPTVFVYQGEHGDPAQDAAVHHYLIGDDA